MHITNFKILHPSFCYNQRLGLEALEELHIAAEQGDQEFRNQMRKKIEKVCCKEDKIQKRHTVIEESWLLEKKGFGDRSRLYGELVDGFFQTFYPSEQDPPADLIHVTCTGYRSPSAAQKIVLKRGWEAKTEVTHAYHMGCMAALPALRMALGFLKCGKPRVDVVHTELCSLHLNPSLHSEEQLVAQSLFADGLIKYSLSSDSKEKATFRIATVYEELIPNTEENMKWECEDWGLKMTLSKEIPFLIGRSIAAFVAKLEQKSGLSLKNAHYAIHPGGPKIVEMIGKKLALSESQLATSMKILFDYGNMSSATLPHIWENMLQDPEIPNGRTIVSLAFGPGLCMAGAVFQKLTQE